MGFGRRGCPVGAVDIGEDFRNRGQRVQGNFAIDIDGFENFDQIGILADFHPGGESQFENLIGERTVSLGDNARRRRDVSSRR